MPPQSLEAHYSAIRDALAIGNLPGVSEAACAGLLDHPTEAGFAKIQIVALIKQEKARQALACIDKALKAKLIPPKDVAYEAAYCEFVAQNYDSAKARLKNVSPGLAVSKLAAQIAYKSGQFSECVDIYGKILSKTERDSQEYTDLLLNMSAAKAAAAQHGGSTGLDEDLGAAHGGYELMFNSATRLIASDKAHEALALLDNAAKLAAATLANDGWSEQDIRGETAPIEAQRAVALQQLGKSGEARAIYTRLLSEGLLDTATQDVVDHNRATIDTCKATGGNISLSASQAKCALLVPGRSAGLLSRYQKTSMLFNMVVVQVAQKQYAVARRSLRALGKTSPDLAVAVADAGIVSATISLHMGKRRLALNELAAMSFARPPMAGVRATLAAAQTAIQLGENRRAADILDTWKSKARAVALDSLKRPSEFARHYFGICLLHNWLQEGLGAGQSEAIVAADAAKHLYTEAATMSKQNADLLLAVGDCLAFAGNEELARECLQLAKAAASEQELDMGALLCAPMLTTFASEGSSPKSTSQLLRGYTWRAQLSRAVPGIPLRFARRFQPTGNSPLKSIAAGKPKAKHVCLQTLNMRRARRQRKLAKCPPKQYAEGRVPDAERWTPLRQRSYYKTRGRGHRQAKLRGGAQGGAVDANSGLGGTGSARIGGKASGTVPSRVSPDVDDGNGSQANDAVTASVSGLDSGGSKSKPKPAK
ncbi:Srp72p, partial [Coemansia sp. RSA 2320]